MTLSLIFYIINKYLEGNYMANLVLGIVFILINLSLLILFYKLFGKTGLFVWVAIATIIANIQVNKTSVLKVY